MIQKNNLASIKLKKVNKNKMINKIVNGVKQKDSKINSNNKNSNNNNNSNNNRNRRILKML